MVVELVGVGTGAGAGAAAGTTILGVLMGMEEGRGFAGAGAGFLYNGYQRD